MFPNPASQDVLFIESASGLGEIKYQIFRTDGVLVEHGDIRIDEKIPAQVAVGNLPSGAYFIQLLCEKSDPQTLFFTIQK